MRSPGLWCGPCVHVGINVSTHCMTEESQFKEAFSQAVKGRKTTECMQQHIKIIECETGPPCLEKHQIAFEGSQTLAVRLAGV